MRLFLLALVAALVAGCGSGGGESEGAAGTAVEPGFVTVELGTQAQSAATVVYAVELTLRLPAGVTLPTDPASGALSQGVLKLADDSAFAGAKYLPATAGSQASLKLNIADTGGFAVGDLAVLSGAVAPGTEVGVSGFALQGFSARDANGEEMTGITPHLAIRTY